jgi:hypothetical protein
MKSESSENAKLEAWLDGLASPDEAREIEARVAGSSRLQGEVEVFRRIEAALARQFSAPAAATAALGQGSTFGAQDAHLSRGSAFASRRRAAGWLGLAAAAAGLAAVGFWGLRDSAWWQSTPVPSATPLAAKETCELDRVFCDALAENFQPKDGCRITSEWDSRLLASLGSPTCNTDSMVVLGEWRDPRLNHSDIVMLRVGQEPVMLLVPKGEQAAEANSRLCLSQGSLLHLHRGEWEGRELYELSKLTESRVLECVQAADVRPVRF